MVHLRVVGPEEKDPIEVGSFAENPNFREMWLGTVAAGKRSISDRYWKFRGDSYLNMSLAVATLMQGVLANTVEFRGIETDVIDSVRDLRMDSEPVSYLTMVVGRSINRFEGEVVTDRVIMTTNLRLSSLYFPYQLPFGLPDQPPSAS